MSEHTSQQRPSILDVLIVGAGPAGLYALHRVRELGLTARVLESGADVGGTWYWNRYPGARCDVPSLEYCYTFSEKLAAGWRWSERFAGQPEIYAYLRYVADSLDLRRDIAFNRRVTGARYDDERAVWTVEATGMQPVDARYVISATGGLSVPVTPQWPGQETFEGHVYHTAKWPDSQVDLSGQRVGVVGTGASGIQCVPVLAETVSELYVFQRTPNFSMPCGNRPLSDAEVEDFRTHRDEYRARARQSRDGLIAPPQERAGGAMMAEELEQVLEQAWQTGGRSLASALPDMMTNRAVNDAAAAFVQRKIREIVADEATARLLTRQDHFVGTRRVPRDTGYYEAFNRDNVHLVDVRTDPIVAFDRHGLVTSRSRYRLDSVVLATGFDALTGAALAIDFVGRSGRRLSESWADGPLTYLGLMVPEFPNLFLISGPGSPSVFVNMFVGIEQHVEWIADLLIHLEARQIAAFEPEPAAVTAWTEYVSEVASATLFGQSRSWYTGANIGGKPEGFMPLVSGFGNYVRRCDEIAAAGYEGFRQMAAGALLVK